MWPTLTILIGYQINYPNWEVVCHFCISTPPNNWGTTGLRWKIFETPPKKLRFKFIRSCLFHPKPPNQYFMNFLKVLWLRNDRIYTDQRKPLEPIASGARRRRRGEGNVVLAGVTNMAEFSLEKRDGHWWYRLIDNIEKKGWFVTCELTCSVHLLILTFMADLGFLLKLGVVVELFNTTQTNRSLR